MKKSWKWMLVLLMALALMLALSACMGDDDDESDGDDSSDGDDADGDDADGDDADGDDGDDLFSDYDCDGVEGNICDEGACQIKTAYDQMTVACDEIGGAGGDMCDNARDCVLDFLDCWDEACPDADNYDAAAATQCSTEYANCAAGVM